jgi:hypothetical protein
MAPRSSQERCKKKKTKTTTTQTRCKEGGVRFAEIAENSRPSGTKSSELLGNTCSDLLLLLHHLENSKLD